MLHLILSVCTQFHQLLFGRPLGRLPWELLLNTRPNFVSQLILLIRPTQFNRIIPPNLSISKSSLLYRFLQFSFPLILPNIRSREAHTEFFIAGPEHRTALDIVCR